jgi:hypothetical protein
MNTDRPKLLGDAAAVTARLLELHAPHIVPLTAFVEELRVEAGPGAEVPYLENSGDIIPNSSPCPVFLKIQKK